MVDRGKIWVGSEDARNLLRNVEIQDDEKRLEVMRKKLEELRAEFNRERTPEEKEESLGGTFVGAQTPYVDIFLMDVESSPGHGDKKKALTEFFERELKGKDFFDLGCGSNRFFIRKLNEFLAGVGVERYIGVDLRPEGEKYEKIKNDDGSEIDSYILKGEILGFLQSIPDGYGGNFFCSGLEEYFQESDNKDVLRLFKELFRVTKTDDLIIVGGGRSLISVIGNLQIGGVIEGKKDSIEDEQGNIMFRLVPLEESHPAANTTVYRRV